MAKFGSITHGEFTGDIIAGQITKALEAGEPIWRAVGNVLDLFFDEAWIEISFDPSVTPVYGQGDSPVSPLTKAWQVDPLTDLPVAIWFKSGWGLLEWSQWWTSAGGPTFPTRWPGPMTPVGADDAGTPPSNQWADGRHSHPYAPAPPPTTLATSTLYTAKVGASLNMGDVYCAFLGPHTAHTNNAMFEGQFTEISPGVMQRILPGIMPSYYFDGIDVTPSISVNGGVSPIIGKRVVAYYQGDTSSTGAEEPYQLVWIIDDVGMTLTPDGSGGWAYNATYARMRLDPSMSYSAAWGTGMKFSVENGTLFGGGYFTFLNTPPFVLRTTFVNWSWTAGAIPPSDEKWELLTGPQLTSEGALSTTLQQSVSGHGLGVGIGFNETLLPEIFDSLVIDVAALAAGPYVFDVEDVAASPTADPGALVVLRAKLYDDTTGTLILFADAPITAVGSRPEAPHFVGVLASPYTWTPGHKLRLKYALWTDSATDVLLGMTYNSSARGTKLTVPFVMPVTGASDGVHDHLSGRDTVNNHFGVGTCTTASGVIPTPTKRKMVVTVSGATTLTEMGTAGLEDGVEVDLVFLQACAILNGATAAAGNAPFILESVDGTPITSIDWTEPATALGRIGVTYYKTALPASPCFLLTKGPLV